jgi:hypothetical protein
LSKASRAVLLSALVFPGAGHFFLKRKLMAWGLIITSSLCLYKLIVSAIDTANSLTNKILQGDIPLEIDKISAAVSLELANNSSIWLSLASWLLLACWIFGIVDAYRVAKSTNLTLG